MTPISNETTHAAHKRSKRTTTDLIRNARHDAAKHRHRQHAELERVDAALAIVDEAEVQGSSSAAEDIDRNDPYRYKFRGMRELREAVNEYTALLKHISGSNGRRQRDIPEREHSDSDIEIARGQPATDRAGRDRVLAAGDRSGRDRVPAGDRSGHHRVLAAGDRSAHDRVPAGDRSAHDRVPADDRSRRDRVPAGDSATDLRSASSTNGQLAITSTNTVQILPQPPICYCDNAARGKQREILSDARQSVKNRRVHSSSEHGSLSQLIKPTSASLLRSPYPFLSQAGRESHSLHAAAQNVLGSIKRTLPGFHQAAVSILNNDIVDMVSAFAVSLRRYDDRILSQIKVLIERYDLTDVNSMRRSELMCEIDHLYKISRTANNKRDQLLEILHGQYYQGVTCPLLRQLKILHTTFASGPA